MKDRGKAVEASTFFSDAPCRKHPSSSSVGICAFCLKDRLIKLVCSDCGEQRLSSCSCSDISSSYRNSCSVEVGSVGRISFLIENDTATGSESAGHLSKPSLLSLLNWNSKLQHCREKHEADGLLKRNSSSSVFEKRRDFWHLGWIFKRKREMGLSESRSVCGFDESEEGFGFHRDGMLESGDGFGSMKMGGFTELEGGILESGGGFDSLKRDGFLETDGGFIDLKFGLDGDRTSESAESGFGGMKRGGIGGDRGGGLIDLKVGFSTSMKGGFPCLKGGGFSEREGGFEGSLGDLRSGGSCRIRVDDESGITATKKGSKVWKWIFGSSSARNSIERRNGGE
ncbi:uncharacterized protein LOC131257979 [Magnolia sinica]|uniref:uncharacterized protein LOC131257979 n=1 Tax=Magnolia sinica TaxID=86752 RepID=UPI0026582681|nr:uncharacterized protein LOC131257979 [Magnolia sinica]